MDQKQLDRIEGKLDEVLQFRDLLLKMAMPKIPPPMRKTAAALLAERQRT